MIPSEQSLSKSIEGLYEQPLSPEEKNEAVRNLTGFLNLLVEIDQSLKSPK